MRIDVKKKHRERQLFIKFLVIDSNESLQNLEQRQ